MQKISFRSSNPMDDVCRALDVVRRMGLDFVGLWVEPASPQAFEISLSVELSCAQAAETLLARLSGCVGISIIAAEADHPATPAQARNRN